MPTEAPLQSIVKGAVDQLARSLSDLGTTVSSAISDAATSANSIITGGLTPINQTLGLIKTTLAGTLNVNAIYATGDATTYKGFTGTLTGTTGVDAWTPDTGKRFLLKGYAVTGIVSTDLLAASAGVLLYFADSNTSSVVAPIAALAKTAAAETSVIVGASGAVGQPVVVHLGSGRQGSVANAKLQVKTDITIGTGDIKVVGVVWGNEV